MPFGICPYSVVPLRSVPAHSGEMLSQLLFGELMEILDAKGKQWLRIRCVADQVEGWIDRAQCKEITVTEFEQYRSNFAFSLELVQAVMGADHFVPVTMGARLPNYDGLHFRMGDLFYTFSGQALSPAEIQPNPGFLLKMAKRYLNTPFLWGGRSPFGIDSAGFVQVAFQFAGISLPREAGAQIELGVSVDFPEQAQPGDIAFFENQAGRIIHSGIVMPDNKIIHAYGCVRIDLLDHYGIFDEDRKQYTRRLRLIKRVLPPAKTAPISDLAPSSVVTNIL